MQSQAFARVVSLRSCVSTVLAWITLVAVAGAQANEPYSGRMIDLPFGALLQVEAADLDGDGDVDLLAPTSGQLRVLLNQGGGVFAAPISYPVGTPPYSVAVADGDADGDRDVFVANYGSSNVSVLRNQGAGVLASAGTHAAGPLAYGIAVADLNADTRADIVVGSYSGNLVNVLLSTGPLTFAGAVPYPTGGAVTDVRIADLNGDAIPDIASANLSGPTLSIFIGAGNGTFAPASSFGTNHADALEAVDLDRDGDLDLAVSASSLWVYWNSGAGSFATSSSISVGLSPFRIDSADLDGDQQPELAVCCGNDDSVYVVRRTTGTSLALVSITNVGAAPRDCDLSDVDGDGLLDVVSACQDANAVSWNPGRGDGSFGGAKRLWAASNIRHLVARDFTGDGVIDLAGQNTGQVLLAVGAGNGQFASPAVAHTFGFQITDIASGDLDGDLDLDIAVARHQTVPYALLLNDGTGGFAPVVTASGPWVSNCLTLADLDGDSDLDIVSGGNTDVRISLNLGGASFGPTASYPVQVSATSVTTADVDGDLDRDVVLGGTGRIMVLLNSGTGTFGASAQYPGTAFGPIDLLAADIDQDGDIDVIAAASEIDVYRNNGNGTFAAATQVVEPHLVNALALVDIDANGVLDLVSCNETGTIAVRAKNANGTFAAPRYFPGFGDNRHMDVGDFDGDLDLDLATSSLVALSQHTEPPSAYCTGQVNAAGCIPIMSFSGVPSVSQPAPYLLRASRVVGNRAGLLFYGPRASSTAFLGGTLCVGTPIRRTGVQNSGGTPPPPLNCTGSFSVDFNAYIQGGSDPLLVAGAEIFTQYWARDTQTPPSTSLSNAIQFRIRP